MTQQQKDIIEYHKLHPNKSRKEIAEAFGIRIYFVNKAFDRYKTENAKLQPSLFNEPAPKRQPKVGDRADSWQSIYSYHKGFNPMVYNIPAKLFWSEMEKTRWRYEGVYIANWKMTYIKWLREQQRTRPWVTKSWAQAGKII